MALVDISEHLPGTCTELSSICRVHGDQVARLIRDHADETVALRRKIDALESALATAQAGQAARVASVQASPPLTSISFGTPVNDAATGEALVASGVLSDSPFSASQQPAVVSVGSVARRVIGTDASAVQANLPSTDDAAVHSVPTDDEQVAVDEDADSTNAASPWGEGEASFEERMAAREFFADAEPGHEPAWRRWLLKKA